MAETRNNPPQLVQKPLFEASGSVSSSSLEAPEAQPGIESFSPQAFISEGNSVEKPQGLGLRDLTDSELNGAYETLSQAEQSFHEDQNGDPVVRFTRPTESGPLNFSARLSLVNGEIARREEAKRLEKANKPPKLTRSEKAKLRREEEKKEYWNEIFEKRRKYGERPPF